ncbi:hypothetical protein HPB49_021889 [Dermacentor silvarum]|uniref:Uncharacterized protein n=1 Tax=Dermacentor silvarum TaxID=543639 RepID=A0ACB8DR67_DERSI|nr:hypothetical protein HPB49_021889 [Dermacentor silvarum]
MADGVDSLLAANQANLAVSALQPGPTDPGGSRLARIASSPHNHRRIALIACGVAAFLALSTVIVTLGVYLIKRHRRSDVPSSSGGRPFCCPHDAELMARFVNTTVSPCDDFFAYVCSRAEGGLSGDIDEYSELHRAVITGVMPGDVPKSHVARFLAAYYKTCVRAIAHYDHFSSSLANAFLRDTGDLLSKANSREAITFSAIVSMRYSFPAVIDVSYEIEREVSLEFAAICDIRGRYHGALAAATEAIVRTMNTTATLSDTVELVTALCGRFREVRSMEARYHVAANGSSAFNQEVWNIEDLEAAMSSLGFSLKDVPVITVQGFKEIRLLYEMFNGDDSPGSKAAYLLWHAVVSGVQEFNVPEGEFSPLVFETCRKSLFTLQAAWDFLKVELLTSEEKDAQARSIYATIKDTAHKHFKESSLFDAEDLDELEEFFKKVELVTPTAVNKASIQVPEATFDFAENLLKAYAFEVNISAARMSILSATRMSTYRDVFIVEDRYILLSTTSYSYIRTGPPSESHLPNMALLGELLAESLWGMALYIIKWKSKTVANIERLRECFAKNYLKDPLDEIDASVVILSALGLSTVVKALNLSEWHLMKPAWSLWKLSEAQFFYITSGHHRCPRKSSPEMSFEINAPLIYIADFAESFGCVSNTSMRNPHYCLGGDMSRK